MRIGMLIGLAAVLAAGPLLAAEESDTEARLEQARERLEEAAREIAELTAELGTSAVDVVKQIHIEGRRAMLGINIGGPGEGPEDGVKVFGVTPGGPADDAGLRSGDIITAVNGQSLNADDDGSPTKKLLKLMRDVEPGDMVTVEYERDGGRLTAAVLTEELEPHAFSFGFGDEDYEFHLPDAPRFLEHFQSRWGKMELASLTPALGEYFGTQEGLLVVRGPDDPDIDLRDGDVIQRIDGRTPTSPSHAMRILRSYQSGERLQIEIVRRQRPMTLDIELKEQDTEYSQSAWPSPAPRALPVPPPIET